MLKSLDETFDVRYSCGQTEREQQIDNDITTMLVRALTHTHTHVYARARAVNS